MDAGGPSGIAEIVGLYNRLVAGVGFEVRLAVGGGVEAEIAGTDVTTGSRGLAYAA